MNIAEKIKTARNQAGLSQQELADRLHVSRSAVAKWEAGKGLPDIENLKSISKLFGMTLDELVDDEEEDVPCTLRESLPPGSEPDDAIHARWPEAVRIDRLFLEHDFGWPGRILNFLTFGWVSSIWRTVHFDECYTDRYYLVDTFAEHIFVRIHDDNLYFTPLSRRLLRSERDNYLQYRGRTYMGGGKLKRKH